jgi:hypothetical protein
MLACRLANGELFRMVGREADTLLVMAVPGDGSLPSQTPGSSAHTPKTNTVMVLAICEVRHQAVIANGIATASHPPLPLDTRLGRAWACLEQGGSSRWPPGAQEATMTPLYRTTAVLI